MAEDWIWIIDHSVQAGVEKCLVILGIRLRDLPVNRALRYEDVEPIELIPVTKSNGEIVYEQLKTAKEKTGAPREIVADKGSDIKSGIERFCSENKETCYVHDIKHGLAILLEKKLANDTSWKDFTGLCRDTKRLVQQTDLASLAPPSQRSKARYMNIDVLVNWGDKILTFLDQGKEKINKQFDFEKVIEKLNWVNNYRTSIEKWTNLMNMISCAENFVRNNGLSNNTYLDLEDQINKLNIDDGNRVIKDGIINFIKTESDKAKSEERLLGSSEIIESLFGKQKNIENQQSKSGFTGLLLSLAAIVSTNTKDVIQQAMTSVKTTTVIKWYENNIGASVQAKRAGAFKFHEKYGTKTVPNLLEANV